MNCSNPLSQNSKLLDDYDFNDQIQRPGEITKNILEEEFDKSSLGEFFGNEK